MLSDREKAGLPAGKKISLSINRDNVILIGIFGTDLGPEVKDMPPYRAGICSCTAAPYRFVELLCRKNLLLVFCKETQQREFGPGKACVGIIEICMAVRKIQPQAADGDLTGGLKFFFYFFFHSFLAFQKHLDHGQKFIEIIRFGEIIVASLLKSFYPIPDITFSGEKRTGFMAFRGSGGRYPDRFRPEA